MLVEINPYLHIPPAGGFSTSALRTRVSLLEGGLLFFTLYLCFFRPELLMLEKLLPISALLSQTLKYRPEVGVSQRYEESE
jgi:hypothetical protein